MAQATPDAVLGCPLSHVTGVMVPDSGPTQVDIDADLELERQVDAFYQAHKHEWEFDVGDLVVLVSQGSGLFRDACIYLGLGADCYHRFWDIRRRRVIDTPWKQGEVVSRLGDPEVR